MTLNRGPLAVLAGVAITIGCGGGKVGWERRPIFEERYLETYDLAIAEGAHGFLGASKASEETIMMPNFKKAKALDTAIIQETRDDWITRTEAFRTTGEINSILHLDSGRLLAVNPHVDLDSLKETTRFIKWGGLNWRELSSVPARALRVWSNAGPILFAAGYPEEGFDPLLLYASFDGAATWRAINLAGVDPLDTSHDEQVWLDGAGLLYAFNGRNLESFDLPRWEGNPGWKTVQPVPEDFKPIRLSGDAEGMYTVGRLPDKALALWKVPKTGSPTLVRAKGLPDTLQPERLWVHDRLIRITGTQEMTKNGETTGYRNFLFESKDDGATWRDMGLPITGSIGAITFGEEGRIWVMAAGNRMQVYHP